MTAPIAALAARRAKELGREDPSPVRGVVASLILALWIGAALLLITTVAPAAFAVLPSRTLAGALVGRVLPVVFISGIAIGIFSLMLHVRSGAKRVWAHRIGILVLVLGCLGAQGIVAPRIAALRAQLPADMEQVSITDARRVAFGQMHGVSVALLGLAMLGAATALVAGVLPFRRSDS
jgi:hypothetical protein